MLMLSGLPCRMLRVSNAAIAAERGMMMKKLIAVLCLLLALCLAGAALAEQPDRLQALRDKGYAVIGTEGVYQPWNYEDENGVMVGYDVEVAAAVCAKLGIEARFVPCQWDGLFTGLDNSNRFDFVFASVEPTEERAKKYNFSEPYAYTRTVLIVSSDNDQIDSFEALKGRTTCNTITSVYAQLAESYGAEVTAVDDLAQTLMLVESGRCDATLNADTAYYDYMKAHPDAKLKVVDQTEEAVTIVTLLPKGDDYATLMDAINAALRELREEGVLSELSVKYFGGDISSPTID